MYQDRLISMMELRLQHRHSDGSWGEMSEQRRHHDPSEHDIERTWGHARIYKCEGCDEMVTIVPGTEGGPQHSG